MLGVFADTTTAVTNLQQVGINLLAIAGAFLVGTQFTKYFVIFIFKTMTKKKQPPPRMVQTLLKYVGGVIFAIIVALLVFGDGSGFGFGSGRGTGPGDSENKDQKKDSKFSTETESTRIEVTKKEIPKVIPESDLPPADQRERIVVLGGYDRLERYYRLEGKTDRVSLTELIRYLREKQQSPIHPLKGVTILVYKNSPAMEHRLVKDLQKWASEQKLSVDFPPVQDRMMP